MKLRMLFSVLWVACSIGASAQVVLLKKIDRFTNSLTSEFGNISSTRKAELNKLADQIVVEKSNLGHASVVFNSNNNSTLSQMSQVWMQVALDKYRIKDVSVVSSGVTASEIGKETIYAFKVVGFNISTNTVAFKKQSYLLRYSWDGNQVLLFSKKSDNYQIPVNNVVISKTEDIVLNEDNAIQMSKQIATEMMYVAEKIQNSHLLSMQQ
jgi:hypothetical protein